MPWGAVVGAVIGGVAANNAAKKGAKATDQASQAAIDEQRRQFDLTRGDQLPFLQAGHGALGDMQALNSGDFSKFFQTPDYAFARDQGLQGIDRSASARGGMFSGGADADRMKFASGLASQNYNQFYNRLQAMAGQGQTTASGLGQLGMGMANNIGNAGMNAAAQRSSAFNQIGNNWASVAGTATGALGQWYGQNSARNGGGTGWYLGNNPGRG